MATNYNRLLYKDYEELLLGKKKADEQVVALRQQCHKLELYASNLETDREKLRQESSQKSVVIEEQNKEIADLQRKIAHLEALLGTDSTNSSLPSSKTPIGKKLES